MPGDHRGSQCCTAEPEAAQVLSSRASSLSDGPAEKDMYYGFSLVLVLLVFCWITLSPSFESFLHVEMRLRIGQAIRVTEPYSSASQFFSEDSDLYLPFK